MRLLLYLKFERSNAMEQKNSKDRLREITDSIEQGINDLFESEKYRQYLRTMSRFHRYSVNNTLLIAMQRPDATHIAGFSSWRNQFGRHVRKGEKGIQIIAPTPYKKKIDAVKVDPDTKAPILDQNGNAIMEEIEIKIPMFRVVSVFDVSQTEGRPLPEIVSDLTGDVQQYDTFMEALHRSSPVPVSIESIAPTTDGYFSLTEQSITIRAGMSEVQTVCATVHEIVHAKLHNYGNTNTQSEQPEEIPKKDQRTKEVEAESIAYAVCQYYGIETAENSFGYIAGWSKGKELSELRASLETINQTASELIDDIDRRFMQLCEERGIENALKNAEMSLEDDYGMIDGIINNGQKNMEEKLTDERPSVLQQIKNTKKTEQKRPALKCAEMER